jgi:predicted PurR-regulated permease PerM
LNQGQEEGSNVASPSDQKFIDFLSKGLGSIFNTIGKTYSLIISVIAVLFILYVVSKRKRVAAENR